MDVIFSDPEIEMLVGHGVMYYQIAGKKVKVLPADMDIIYDVCDVVNLVSAIVSGGDFSVKEGGKWKINRYGKKLISCIDSVDVFAIDRALSGGRGHPYVSAFNEIGGIIEEWVDLQGVKDWRSAEYLNAAVNAVRSRLDDKFGLRKLREESRSIARGVQKNIDNIICFFDRALNSDLGISVVNVDLRYAYVPDLMLTGKTSSLQAKAHLFDFIREVEKRAKETLVGHVWKLGFGLSSRYCSRIIYLVKVEGLSEFESALECAADQWQKTSVSDHVVYVDWDVYGLSGVGQPSDLGTVSDDARSALVGKIYQVFRADIFLRPDLPSRERVFGRSGPGKSFSS